MSNKTENESMQYCATINPEDPSEYLLSFVNGTHIEVERNMFPCVSKDDESEEDVRRCCAAMVSTRNDWGLKPIDSFWKFHWSEAYRMWLKIYYVEYTENRWPEYYKDITGTKYYFPSWVSREYHNCVLIYLYDKCDYKYNDQYEVCCEVNNECECR